MLFVYAMFYVRSLVKVLLQWKKNCWHDVREFVFVSNFYKISNVITENYYANETLKEKSHVSLHQYHT